MNASSVASQLVDWISTRVGAAGVKGTVFGLSGGIDSAVVAGLCKQAVGQQALGIIMPCHSQPRDEDDARLISKALNLEIIKVDLSVMFDHLIAGVEAALNAPLSSMALANTKARLRMTTLYSIAASRSALVIGTGNRSELTYGYYTKYGDSGVDLLPLGNLVKAQVYELARFLAIPERVIEKAPSAGLWEGQTDEQEMGLTYQDLDRYILTGEATPEVAARIQKAYEASEHKRSLAPIAPVRLD